MRGVLAADWLSGRFVRDAGLLAIAAALCTCAPSSEPARGFGSRQVLAIRDPWLTLRAFTADESRVYLARYVQMPAPFGAQPPADVSTVDLASGEQKSVAPAVLTMTRLTAATGQGRSEALVHYPTDADVPADFLAIRGALPGRLTVSLVDETTGERVEISDVSGTDRGRVIFGNSVLDPIGVERLDEQGNAHQWFGPPGELRAAPAETVSILGFDATGAFTYAVLPGTLEAVVRRLPLDGGEGTTIVSAAGGDRLVLPDQTGTITEPAPGPTRVMDPRYVCAAAASGAPNAQPPPCYLLYGRSNDLNGPTQLFAQPIDDPREWALPGQLTEVVTTVATTPSFVLWTGKTASGPHLFSWNYGADHAGGCDAPGGSVFGYVQSASGRRFGVATVEIVPGVLQSQGRWVLGTPGGTCRLTENTLDTGFREFSPDESTVVWIELSITTSMVHLTDFDGGADQSIPIAGYVYDAAFLDARRLVIFRSSGDGTSISWIDVESSSITEHVIGDRVSMWAWLGPRWLLIGDSKSEQDDTFTLRLVDVDTGTRRTISPSVADFSIPWTTPPPGATQLPVAYLVRGRGPSAQDGVWLAHVPLADLPP